MELNNFTELKNWTELQTLVELANTVELGPFGAAIVANWILSLGPFTDSFTGTNNTALVFKDTDVASDGLTLVTLPDSDGSTTNVPIMNGMQYNSTTNEFSFFTSDDKPVAKLIEPDPTTASQGAVPTLDPLALVDRVDDEVVVAGDIRRLLTDEGLRVWVIYTAGTVDSSQPSISISQIGDDIAVTDNTSTFKIQSLQTATGLYSGLETNQFLATPETPANQTTGSLVTDTYILTMLGTGSVSATDNTATSDAAGQSASEGSPLVIVVSGAGTIDMVVTGSVDTFNLQDSPVETPFILTTPRSETVTSTPIAETRLTPQAGYGVIIAKPDRAGQSNIYVISSFTDFSNYIAILVESAAQIKLRQLVGGSVTDADINYTHSENTPFVVVYGWDSSGNLKITASDIGAQLPTVGTDTGSTTVLSTTLETGSRNGGNQFQGEILFNGTFDSFEQAVKYIDDNNLADTSNL